MEGDGFEWAQSGSEAAEYDLGERLDGRTVPAGTNLLVAGPPMAGTRRFGIELLAGRNDDRPVIVTNRETARTIRDDHADCLDGPVAVVDCVSKRGSEPGVEHPSLRYVGSPDDLTGIGMELSDLLSGRHQGAVGSRVLFDSVSTLLMYSGAERASRFLEVVTARIERQGAIGLFVLNSAAHDEGTYERLSDLFDGVVRLDADGGVETDLPEA